MERDFERYVHRKRRAHRAAAILVLLVITAVVLVWIHSCSNALTGPYDSRDYRPVDVLPENLR